MSYQPDPAAGAQPAPAFGQSSASPLAPPQYSYGYSPTPVTPDPPAGKRRKGLMFAGIGVALVGIVTGVALLALSGAAKEKTVKRFARAPVGCTTTLQFDKAATFTIYIETKGSVGAVGGDCAASGSSYERSDGELPSVSLTLLNSADAEVAQTATDTPSYSVGAFDGQGYQRLEITEPGIYRLTVTSDASDFAIAVGGDPDVDANALSVGGVGAALAGFLLGGVLMLLGLRKKKPPITPAPVNSAPAMWQPVVTALPGCQPQATTPGAVSGYPTTAPTTTGPPTTGPAAPPQAPGWGPPTQ